MRVDPINWYSSRDRVLEDCCGHFEAFADVFPAYIVKCIILEESQEKGFRISFVVA
jgi:hypothetical protein